MGSSDKGFFMYLEYVTGGTLADRIDELGTLKPSLAMIYAKQMLSGLAFMHKNQVIHRDLKPANVLISAEGQVKLADFGTAFDMSVLTHTVLQTLCGTPAFIAPEVIRKEKHTTATDIWSMGVIMYNMITGDIPFSAKDKYALLHEIASGKIEVLFPENFPVIFREIIDACLQFNPQDRPSAREILDKLSLVSTLPDSACSPPRSVTESESESIESPKPAEPPLISQPAEIAAPKMVRIHLESTTIPVSLYDIRSHEDTSLDIP